MCNIYCESSIFPCCDCLAQGCADFECKYYNTATFLCRKESRSNLDVWLRRYQGARVEMWRRGVFRGNIVHYDVGSMYPSVMILLNLSSENVKLVGLKPYNGQFVFDAENNFVEIADNYRGQVQLSIGEEESVTRRFMLRFREMRQEAKRQGGKLGESKQKAVKLIMNFTYGYHGLEFSRYGSFLVAIATAGTGRFIMDAIVNKIRSEHKKIKLIECDTDGIYTQGEDITDEINGMIQDELFKDYEYRNVLAVGTNRYDGMISYSMKNYVLRRGDTNLFKGSAFHGRHMPRICVTALNRFADAIFNRENLRSVWSEFINLRQFPLREFTMSVQLGKVPDQYDEGTMYADLSKKLEDPIWGQDIYYVKTADGYTPLGSMSDREIRRRLDTKTIWAGFERLSNV